ncbi:3-phenylpropionate/cinnamic acid dioxygenase small subunit [Scopulibacillus darangshiensis]|uniref:3-phenylpropionate/cinnamic acid dioxygenase small subunit n=1 Tax=Scopulibacillus darangshiensis TaxID=442528 RepID=A0A4R2P9V0_9BACL|nr:3-phenylpropionate/cinnamic acid dioxygenase subunit beta [Scopulibacillus darangshiensis]TCP31707.1 3-phenylpropionate/cinnamic acid dioxygenase small subunit [Scopulibacillus darangshiensis]
MSMERLLAKHIFEEWLYHEAKCLDEIEFDRWFNLMHPDLRYEMPVRVNKEGMERPDYATDMFAFQDDINTLKMRVERLKTEYAWAEMPPSRTRRFVSNVRVAEFEDHQRAVVNSYLLIYRSRSTDIEHDLISGERRDEFKYLDGDWKLSKRFFLVDQTTLNTRNLAIFV